MRATRTTTATITITKNLIRGLALAGVMLIAGAAALAADDHWGYTGPGAAPGFPDVPVIAIKQAKELRDDTFTAVEGKIERALGKELYLLSGGGDTLTVEIDKHLWYGLTVGPNDTVIIYGEVDRDKNAVVLEARRMIKK